MFMKGKGKRTEEMWESKGVKLIERRKHSSDVLEKRETKWAHLAHLHGGAIACSRGNESGRG